MRHYQNPTLKQAICAGDLVQPVVVNTVVADFTPRQQEMLGSSDRCFLCTSGMFCGTQDVH